MRPIALVSIAGMILLGGLAISYAGSEVATAGLEEVAGTLDAGNTLRAMIELDPATSADGVYAIRSVGDVHGGMSLSVTEPGGASIAVHAVDGESYESSFAIEEAGGYALEATNGSDSPRTVVVALGYKADAFGVALVVAGSYVIISGMVAMAAVVAYAVKKSRSS